MLFSMDVIRARKGDCLILHFGSKEDPRIILIDGGPSNVYGPQLKPRLTAVRKARGLAANKPLDVDRLMVSHVDDDHIRGVLDLTRDLIDNPGAPLVRIAGSWHNSFDDIVGKNPAELTASFTAQFGAAAVSGELPEDAALASTEDPEVVHDSLKVLASIEQGYRLRGDFKRLKIQPNPEFDGKLILAQKKQVKLDGGLAFKVAGPMKPELLELQRKHDEWLENRKEGEDEEAALAAYIDKSVPNLSSVVALATCGKKSMLLTGDARGDKILEGLESVGLLKPGGKLEVDILKVPHHGSSNNLDSDFFERLPASHYVFSGNGEHGNPERETLEMLFGARGADPFDLHFTYPIDEIDAGRKLDWEKEQGKEKARAAKGSKKKPRENWSPAKHSLAAFFKKVKPGPNQRIVISGDGAPHVINLLDDLGY